MNTGISGLDRLLNGGFVRGSTILISGNYGVGKTLFALQYAFAQAKKGEKVLYVSTSEPVFKVKQFATTLSFYDDKLVYAEYRDPSPKSAGQQAGSIEFVESSLGIVTGMHYRGENTLIDDIRNMVEGKSIKHLIIDPITTITMLYEKEAQMRKDILLMGAWLTRLGCTVLLTAEESDPKLLDVEKYLSDCVISLASDMNGGEREFRMIVQKLRGNKQNMNSHLYSFDKEGIQVIHDMSVGEVSPSARGEGTTGIPALDSLMGWLDYGSSWIVSIDDRVNYEPVFSSILASGLKAGEGIVYSPPSRYSFGAIGRLLERFDIDIIDECRNGKAYFIDHYGRKVPGELKDYVLESYPQVEDMTIFSDKRKHWRILSNLNGEYYAHGPTGLRDRYSMNVARVKERGDIYFAYCNFNEIDEKTAEFLRTACDGIIEAYVDGKYQFLRVTKSPSGKVSGARVMVPEEDLPYIRLVEK